MEKAIYIMSGPCGLGKSTVSRALAHEMEEVTLIEGDVIHSMMIKKEDITWDDQLRMYRG